MVVYFYIFAKLLILDYNLIAVRDHKIKISLLTNSPARCSGSREISGRHTG